MGPKQWTGEALAAWTAFAAAALASSRGILLEDCAAYADRMMLERERRIDPHPYEAPNASM